MCLGDGSFNWYLLTSKQYPIVAIWLKHCVQIGVGRLSACTQELSLFTFLEILLHCGFGDLEVEHRVVH